MEAPRGGWLALSLTRARPSPIAAAWLLNDVGAIVAKNIKAHATGAPMKEKKGAFKGILMVRACAARGACASKEGRLLTLRPPPQVPIGAKDGAGQLPFGTVGPRFTAMIKGKGLFLGKVAGGYGYSEAELVRQE